MSIVADQRKRNTPQPRPNVAGQQNTNTLKKASNNKQQQNQNQNQTATKAIPSVPSQPKPKSPLPVPPDNHVPLKGFNTAEIDTLLSAAFATETEPYKPSQPQQKTGPWGFKSGTMATGKNFWLELQKQVTTLQKGESTNKGG